MFVNTKALVLREAKYKEADRILTLLTDNGGKVTAKARGALRKGSKISAATQQLTYSEMTLFGNRDKWTVNEASVIETFDGLKKDLSLFSLGCYFAEVAEALSVEDEPDELLLQLSLNSLYALSHELADSRLIKAAFELRVMSLAGYAPDLSSCAVCGKPEPENPYLSVSDGRVFCSDCRKNELYDNVRLGKSALAASRYIISAPAKKLFSFNADEKTLRELALAAEKYLLRKTERNFSSLEYWRALASFTPRQHAQERYF